MKPNRPLRSFIPNAITLANLAVGSLAVMEAWNGRLERSALLVALCAVLDFFDGFAARMLKAHSELGRELDSLADLVSFGVAPAALAAGLLETGMIRIGWQGESATIAAAAIPLLLPVFSAYRLARFNLEHHGDGHFRGMPVPADATAFVALALIQGGGEPRGVEVFLLHPVFVGSLVVLNSVLMVSKLTMFSFKLRSYRPGANIWRSVFAASSLGMVAVFRGTGLFAVFVLYVLSSVGMSIRLKLELPAAGSGTLSGDSH